MTEEFREIFQDESAKEIRSSTTEKLAGTGNF